MKLRENMSSDIPTGHLWTSIRKWLEHSGLAATYSGRCEKRLLQQAAPGHHRRHQAQHAARALKLHESGPFLIKSLENLRMNRIGRHELPLVICLAAPGVSVTREF